MVISSLSLRNACTFPEQFGGLVAVAIHVGFALTFWIIRSL